MEPAAIEDVLRCRALRAPRVNTTRVAGNPTAVLQPYVNLVDAFVAKIYVTMSYRTYDPSFRALQATGRATKSIRDTEPWPGDIHVYDSPT